MPNAWLLLTFGSDRQYGGNDGYADDPSASYKYDNLVPNSRRLAIGDAVVLRNREAMVGVAIIEEIVARPGSKTLRRCPECGTTKFGERRSLTPRFRCKRGHEFSEPKQERRDCDEFEARFGNSYQRTPGLFSLTDLRAACPRYTDQLSMQPLGRDWLVRELGLNGISLDNRGGGAPLSRGAVGSEYRVANTQAVVGERDPFEVDPHIVERGNRGHAITQNALADFLRSNGMVPRSPATDEPDYDLGWSAAGTTLVSEVKSITDANEEKQLRLGLGQVLRYRQVLSKRYAVVVAVLAAEREPRDPAWLELCTALEVILVWPGSFDSVLACLAEDAGSTGRPAASPSRG